MPFTIPTVAEPLAEPKQVTLFVVMLAVPLNPKNTTCTVSVTALHEALLLVELNTNFT